MLRTFLLALAAAACLTGCPAPNPCDPTPRPPPSGGGGAGVASVVADSSPVDLAFSVQNSACAEEVNASSATAEVLGPNNREVEHTLTFRSSPGPGGTSTAQVTFTPKMPGYYHVAVTFSPVGGRDQRDVLVVHDRSATPARTLTNTSCDYNLFATDAGLLLCDGQAITPSGSKSQFVDQLSEEVVAHGSVAWVYRSFDGRLRRFVVNGASLEQQPDASVILEDVEALFPINDTDLFAQTQESTVGLSTLHLLLGDGGVTSRTSPNGETSVGTTSGLVRPPWFFYSEPLDSDEPETKGVNSKVCSHPLDPSRFAAADAGSCWHIIGTTVGAGRDGFWMWSEQSKTLRLASPDLPDGGLAVIDAITLPRDFQFEGHPPSGLDRNRRGWFVGAVGTTTAYVIPRRQNNLIVLDRLRSPVLQLEAVHDEHIWARDDGDILLWPTYP